MARNQGPIRRPRRLLSPEQKWEIWLEVTSGELTQADAARKWGVDVATVIKLRKDAKDACLSTFALARPGRRTRQRDHEIEELHRENIRLAEAVKELAVELTLVRGYAGDPVKSNLHEASSSVFSISPSKRSRRAV